MKSPESRAKNPQERVDQHQSLREYFDLEIQFAERMASVKAIPIDEALIKYTDFYRRFGFGIPKDNAPLNPRWQEYIAEFNSGSPRAESTVDFYFKMQKAIREGVGAPEENKEKIRAGCFHCSREKGDPNIHIHFSPEANTSGERPLGKECDEARKEELRELFTEIKNAWPDAKTVLGESWLYNLDAYSGLFPPAYAQSKRKTSTRFNSGSRWGQFIQWPNALKQEAVQEFKAKLADDSITDPEEFFPFKVLGKEGNIQEFYKFYGIE